MYKSCNTLMIIDQVTYISFIQRIICDLIILGLYTFLNFIRRKNGFVFSSTYLSIETKFASYLQHKKIILFNPILFNCILALNHTNLLKKI